MNAPAYFQVRNGALVQLWDNSHLNYERNGCQKSLKQNQKTSIKEELTQLNKMDEIDDINQYYEDYKYVYHWHQVEMKEIHDIDVKPMGKMSNQQLKSVRKCIENMINYVLINYDRKTDIKKQNYLAFLTLTLPKKQMHHDRVLRKCLTTFLDNLRKTYNVDKYVWKAEPQKNGNIHFHILIDRYIDHNNLRSLWNRQLMPLGYLETIQNPNSIDIHSLKNVNNAVSYLMKYMTKDEPDKRAIIGTIWGASNTLKKIEYPTIYDYQKEFDDLLAYIYSDKCQLKEIKLDTDYCKLYVGSVYKVLRDNIINVWNRIRHYYKKTVDEKLQLLKETLENKKVELQPITKKINTIGKQLVLNLYENDVRSQFV